MGDSGINFSHGWDRPQNNNSYEVSSDYSGQSDCEDGYGSESGRSPKKEKGKIPENIDITLLEDIPAWFRSLRLHKYTPLFESDNWREIVILDDAALQRKGVAALGARRKMLKVFEMVQGTFLINKLNL